MPFAETDDRVKLYYEETGRGTPIIFVHEFAGDTRSWEAQVRYISRRFGAVTAAADDQRARHACVIEAEMKCREAAHGQAHDMRRG